MSLLLLLYSTFTNTNPVDPGPSPLVQSLPEHVYGLAVHIHEGFWPFQRLATLTTAYDVAPEYKLMQKGNARLSISKTDPAYLSSIIQRGRVLVVDPPSTYRLPEWVGLITSIEESGNNGSVSISAEDYMKVLDSKVGRLADEYTISAGSVVHQIIKLKNAEQHLGLYLPVSFPAGSPTVTMPVGGQTLLQTINEASDRSDYEYEIRPFVTSARIRMDFQWFPRVGNDVSPYVRIYDSHLIDWQYTQNVDAKGSVTAIGGTGRISSGSRKAVTRSASRVQSTALSELVDYASENYIRNAQIPESLRAEYVIYRPLNTKYDELSRESQRELERPGGSAETLDVTLNQDIDWSNIRPGDYLRVECDSIGPSGINRRMRVQSVQPNWELGVLRATLNNQVD